MLLSSRILSNNFKTKIHKTIILPVALYSSETGYLILGEERRLRVFENRVLMQIFRPSDIRMGSVEGSILRKFIVYTVA